MIRHHGRRRQSANYGLWVDPRILCGQQGCDCVPFGAPGPRVRIFGVALLQPSASLSSRRRVLAFRFKQHRTQPVAMSVSHQTAG
jgi:hypothetical protein